MYFLRVLLAPIPNGADAQLDFMEQPGVWTFG